MGSKKITSTFDPHKLLDERYVRILDNLRQAGVEVEALSFPDPNHLHSSLDNFKRKLDSAGMIIHIPALYNEWADGNFESAEFYWAPSDDPRKKRRFDFLNDLNTHIRSLMGKQKIVDADVCLPDVDAVYTTLDDFQIPRIKRLSIEEWEQNKFFPAVFKMNHTSGGKGIYCIDTNDQFRKLFDRNYIIPGDEYSKIEKDNLRSGSFQEIKNEFKVSSLVNCPSNHFTHYRIFSLGNGNILGSALLYSANRKSDDVRVEARESPLWAPFDSRKSPLFLNRRKIVSNSGSGGLQIPLNSSTLSENLTGYEKKILEAHDITSQKVPSKLEEMAKTAAVALGDKGIYMQGQDWIQDEKGNYYCLEINGHPQIGIFNTLYNNGGSDFSSALDIASQKIAEGILDNLNSI